MTDPNLTKVLNTQIGIGYGKVTGPPDLTKQYRIWECDLGHEKMTDPHTLTESVKIQILPRCGQMTDPPTSLKI